MAGAAIPAIERGLMLLLVLVVLLVLSVSHWLLEPLVRGLTPVLSVAGLGWLALASALWLLAGATGDPPSPSRDRSPPVSSVDRGLDGHQPIPAGFRSNFSSNRLDGVERHSIHEVAPDRDDLT
jgi:hypothetical protein